MNETQTVVARSLLTGAKALTKKGNNLPSSRGGIGSTMVGDRLPSTGFRCSAIRTGRVLRWALRPGEMGCSQYGAQPNILLGRWLVQKIRETIDLKAYVWVLGQARICEGRLLVPCMNHILKCTGLLFGQRNKIGSRRFKTCEKSTLPSP